MRANFILILIILVLCTAGCDNGTENYDKYPEITTPASTTKAPTSESPPVQPSNTDTESLPAIIENLTLGLNTDSEEYGKFKVILDSINSNDINGDNIVELTAACEILQNELSNAEETQNNLTENEISAVTSLGMDIDGYNALYENYKFLRNTKIDVLTAITQHLADIENLRNNLDTIIEFYRGYTTFFQMSMYYTVNSILNECKAESNSNSIADFRDNVYPALIAPFADTMQWETDNAIIDEKFQKLYADIEVLVTDFSENSGLISSEE